MRQRGIRIAILGAAAGLAGLLLPATPSVATTVAHPTSDSFGTVPVGVAGMLDAATARAERENLARLQVLFDRFGISPGVVDGLDTPRFRTAREAFARVHGEAVRIDSAEDIATALNVSGGSAFTTYVLTAADVAGPYADTIPVLYSDQARLPRIGYRTAREMLAERFHMDEDFLAILNPAADFRSAGTAIRVVQPGIPLMARVARIEADKARLQVRAYGAAGELVAVYPASIGSDATPSPSGLHFVRNKAADPVWTYNPAGNAQPGLSDRSFQLAPGPNNPVGSAWIGLTKDGYGIHGTPEPSLVGIERSVGCIRLTNWDALELATMVRAGVPVAFID